MSADFNIQTILIAPLDWGLGHATRCIPLIHNLQFLGYKVIIASDGPQEILLKKEFPNLDFLRLPGYQIRYSRTKGWLPVKILQQIPAIYLAVRAENRWLDDVIEQHKIDLVIADNRYGLWSTKVPTVFITHQLTIKAPYPWLEKLIKKVNYQYINRFTTCWVPDMEEGGGLAGVLSHPQQKPNIPIAYLGLLTRFQRKENPTKQGITVLLSGPEPQRSLLEEKIVDQAIGLQQPLTIVRGLPSSKEKLPLPSFIKQFNHLNATELEDLLAKSEIVIARSGYSSLMDLMLLQVKSILIPTPGQTEQEYLAKILGEKNYALSASQETFDLAKLIDQARSYDYKFPEVSLLNTADLQQLIKTVSSQFEK
ncbi:MAG: glycosyltransferase [Sediminibacterium sp.]